VDLVVQGNRKEKKMTKEEIENLKKERDYYKQRYLEFNDAFLKVNINMEEMLKELKRSKLYERSTNE
jgi:hypothetical protein